MPIENGRYVQLTEDEIQNALETELQAEFGEDIDLTESSVFTTLAEVLAAVLSENQEASLADVYESAFLDTATGEDLDRVVAIIGITRRDATHATGVNRFYADGPVEQNYVIQRGTTVQTDSNSPIQFETTEQSTLHLIDDFEDGDVSNYTGDIASATAVQSNVYQGDWALELDGTSGAHIYNEDIELQRGTYFHTFVRPTANTVPTITYGVDQITPDTYYQIALDEAADEIRVEYVEGGSVTTTIDSTTATINADTYYEVQWDWQTTDDIDVGVINTDTDTTVGTLSGSDGSVVDGYAGFKSGDANGPKQFDWYTTSQVSANVRAVEDGAIGNVGPNAVTVLQSPPTGVTATTNRYPIGDPTYDNTDDVSFIDGNDEETDEELRERAQSAVSGGGDATHDAIVEALINDTENVSSVTIFENKTDTDNTGSGGLPPYSFEAVVFGGSSTEVAETIFDKKAVTARDYGGVNGTGVTETVTADSNGQQFDISFSRPTKVDIDITLDLVIDGTYVGDNAIRDDIVRYIGGTLTDNSQTTGLGVNDDVFIDTIRDIVIGDEQGVIALDQSVDGSPIETTPSYATSDGIERIDIGENEVAQADATNASLTINTREL